MHIRSLRAATVYANEHGFSQEVAAP